MTSNNKKLVKVCPRCGSTNISSGYNPLNGMVKDYCKDCELNKLETWDSFMSIFPTMTKEKAKKLKDKLKKLKKK